MKRYDDADRWRARAIEIRDIGVTNEAKAKADQPVRQLK
jgi:hypothetical protein